jgi:hypothetical protein
MALCRLDDLTLAGGLDCHQTLSFTGNSETRTRKRPKLA